MPLIAIFSLPGTGTDRLVADLSASGNGNVTEDRVYADAVAELPEAFTRFEDKHVILTSQYPRTCLASFAERHADQLIVLRGSTANAVAFLKETTDEPEMAIIRAVSASGALLASLPNPHRWTWMDRGDGNSLLRPRGQGTGMASAAKHQSRAEAILSPIDAAWGVAAANHFLWPQPCFLSGDAPGLEVADAIELTGAARCIIYGPYLHLPNGKWNAVLTMGFDQDVRGLGFMIQFYGPNLIAAARFKAPEAAGRFAAEMTVSVQEPHLPIEVRIFTAQGAIAGSMSLEIAFSKLSEMPAAA